MRFLKQTFTIVIMLLMLQNVVMATIPAEYMDRIGTDAEILAEYGFTSIKKYTNGELLTF